VTKRAWHQHGTAKRTEYGNRAYDSKAEAAYAARLDLEVRAGTVLYWIPQPRVMLGPIPYRPDFLVVEPAGDGPGERTHFVDVKGFEPRGWLTTKRLWAEFGPAPLRVVKRGKLAETIEGRGRHPRPI
jgi:hypothetical protein